MAGTRVMTGLEDLTGGKCNTFKIGRMVARTPEPRYAVKCEKCGTETTAMHSRLRNGAARCVFSACGKTTKRGDARDEQRRADAERENQRIADEREASARRMDLETEGWERPTKYAPTPSPHRVMTQRERIELRQRREAEDAERRALDAPRLAAEREAAEQREAANARERARVERQRAQWAEWVLTGKDHQLYVSENLRNVVMTKSQANALSTQAGKEFANDPEYQPYRTPQNADAILAYLERNGVNIADLATFRAAFHRLRDLGILKEKPAPQAAARVQTVPTVSNTPKPTAPSAPKMYRGRDYATGLDRDFTEREVNRMSSLEYQRAFKIIPSIGELFSAMKQTK